MTTASQPVDPRLAKLLAGEPLEFDPPPTDREETGAEKAARTVQAVWFEALGPKPQRVVKVPLVVTNGIIQGNLDLKFFTFECEVSITRSTFEGAVDCGFATFKRTITLEGSTLKQQAIFRSARAEADFEIMRAEFKEPSNLRCLHVGAVLDARGATFSDVVFDRMEVDGSTFFTAFDKDTPVRFGGPASFLGAHIGGHAEFTGAQFAEVAVFELIQVDGNAVFRAFDKDTPVRFGGEARFLDAHIGGQAEFTGAQFAKVAVFDVIQVDAGAFFTAFDKDTPVRFGGEARFPGADVRGQAVYDGADFQQPAHFHNAHFRAEASFQGARFGELASFKRTQFDGGAYFEPDDQANCVRFQGGLSFRAAIFRSDAQFTRAEFKKAADFNNAHFHGAADFKLAEFAENCEASFIGARFERGISFTSAAFGGKTDFTAAIADRDAYFQGATFSKEASFREARFTVVHFNAPDKKENDPATAFLAGLDLRGFRYERIGVAWRDLLSRLTPHDGQPYTQLETAIRATGDDRTANDVYYARRVREMELRWRAVRKKLSELPRAAFDSVQWGLFRFGVRPYRLLGITLLVLGLGVWVFSCPGAVQSRDVSERKNDPTQLTTIQAIGVSMHQFLPVDIPSGGPWIPSEKDVPIVHGWKVSCSTYATFHRLVGWLLVPLGLAALTGMLRRPTRT